MSAILVFFAIFFVSVPSAKLNKIVPGTCPTIRDPCCDGRSSEPDHECLNDYDCERIYPGRGLKCCNDGCEYICLKPIPSATLPPTPSEPTPPASTLPPTPAAFTYVCPIPPPTPSWCPPEPWDECQTDEDCVRLGKDLVCCKEHCDMTCVPWIRMPITDSSSNSPCATKVCTSPPHSVCKPVGGVPKCVCPSSCPSFRAVKCGSDGVLYDNQCKMEQAACVKNMTITETPRKSCTG